MISTPASPSLSPSSLIHRLPKVRGRYTEQADLAKTTWFRVGGPAEVLFKPADPQDLAFILKHQVIKASS